MTVTTPGSDTITPRVDTLSPRRTALTCRSDTTVPQVVLDRDTARALAATPTAARSRAHSIAGSTAAPTLPSRSHRDTSDARSGTVATTLKASNAPGFGEKTISYFAGFALLTNNVAGAGLVVLCTTFQDGGWLPSLVLIVICCALSYIAALMLVEAVKEVPGNHHFEGRVEFTTLCKQEFPRGLFIAALCAFLFSFQTQNISSIIESVQVTDVILIKAAGKSCALQLYGDKHADVGFGKFGFTCVSGGAVGDSPFGNSYVISIGYVIVLLITIPLGYWNLDENTWVQNLSFWGLSTCVIIWMVQFFFDHDTEWNADIFTGNGTVPTIGNWAGQSQVFGPILFNYVFSTTVPSWVNEKKPGVPIAKTIGYSSGLGTMMFMCVGLLGAASYSFADGDTLLTKLVTQNVVSRFTRISVYVFPIIALVFGIPIYSIIVRYNLLENDICGRGWANFWGAIFPWLAALVLCAGKGLAITVAWSGLLISAPLNFAIPAYLYVRAISKPSYGEYDPLRHLNAAKPLDEEALLWDATAIPATIREEPDSPTSDARSLHTDGVGTGKASSVGVHDNGDKWVVPQKDFDGVSARTGAGETALYEELSPEDKDAAFVALPRSWSFQAKRRTAWAVVILSMSINLAGLVAQVTGGNPLGD